MVVKGTVKTKVKIHTLTESPVKFHFWSCVVQQCSEQQKKNEDREHMHKNNKKTNKHVLGKLPL